MPVPAEQRTQRPPGVSGPTAEPQGRRAAGAAQHGAPAARGRLEQLFEQEGDVLLATASGELSLPATRQAFTQLVQAAVDRNLHRVLIDPRACTGGFAVADFVALAEHLSDIGIHRLQRIAVLSSQRVEVDDAFGETATRNRGANLRVFDDRDRAMAWLTEA